MQKIVISTTSFGKYDSTLLELFRKKGFEIALNPYNRKIEPLELLELAKDAVGLIAGTESLREDVLSRLPILKVIFALRCWT